MQANQQVATGFLRGTGAALNVELGWIPDFVEVINVTDGDRIFKNSLKEVVQFTSGSIEPVPGEVLKGNTSNAYATVEQVILNSGSWDGGDAAGWIVLRPTTRNGTFAAETAYRFEVDQAGDDVLSLAGAQTSNGVDIDTEVAATVTAATQIRAFAGSRGDQSLGFTLGSTISEASKLLYFVAYRGDAGINLRSAP